MDKYRLEVPFLTLNKHGNLLTTSLALDVHNNAMALPYIIMPWLCHILCRPVSVLTG